ncbi:response regulator [candidate division KSB1 bacterium]|nr:response regulator [candidate division KSB1 bacterium]
MEKVEKTNIAFFDKSLLNGGRVLDEILEREGYTANHFESLQNVLEVTMRTKPSVVIIDLDEFGDSVWSTCLELKDDIATRRTGIILVSSANDESLRIKGFDIGADDFVNKPYSKRELVARIKALSRRLDFNEGKKIKVKDIEICIDNVTNLGSYIELEKFGQKNQAKIIQNELYSLLESMGVEKENFVYDGYDVLVHKAQK